MATLTPTTQRITVTADMLWELTAQYPEAEQRIWRGAELVQAGHVERTARPGLFLVRSATGTDSAYQVDQYGCSCWDFQKRGGFCKHRAAVALFQAAERADVEQSDPTPILIHVDPEDEAIPYTIGLRGRLGGEPCDLPPQLFG
jgi:uncharacterized Zn finger protein